jgi:pimeloyl-ACP methyl ester carboxylesterase
MGGYVALNLALRQNHSIRKIVTLGTKFNWTKETVDKETETLKPELMLQKVPTFAKSLEKKHGENWKDLVLKTVEMMREIERKNFLNTDNYKKISVPVLIGLADKDKMVSLDETVAVFKGLPNSSMYMLPGTKHALETANVELLTKIISDFAKQ